MRQAALHFVLLVAACCLAALAAGDAAAPGLLRATPSEVNELVEDESLSIKLYFTNCTDNSTLKHLSISISEGGNLNIDYPTDVYNVSCQLNDNGTLTGGTEVEITGKVIGYVTLFIADAATEEVLLEYPVGVIRKPQQVKDKIFLYGIIILVVFNTMNFGIKLDLQKVKAYLKKPFSPSIGVVCQFIVMPLTGFALTQVINKHPSLELGVFTASVAPGGGQSNVWCFLLGGDVDLSITMTFISTVAALGFVPLWMYTVGQYVIGDEKIELPIENMFTSLASVVAPLVVGLLINRFLPKLAKIFLKLQKPGVAVTILFAIGFGTYANLYVYKVIFNDYQLALCGLSLPWVGGLIAFLIALAFRREKPVALTIAIETAVQNTSVATILLRTTLSQPWADISTAVPIILNLFTPWPFYIILIGRCIYMRRKKSGDSSDKEVLEEESSGDVKAVGLKELENNNNGTTNPVFDSLHAQSSSDKLSEL